MEAIFNPNIRIKKERLSDDEEETAKVLHEEYVFLGSAIKFEHAFDNYETSELESRFEHLYPALKSDDKTNAPVQEHQTKSEINRNSEKSLCDLKSPEIKEKPTETKSNESWLCHPIKKEKIFEEEKSCYHETEPGKQRETSSKTSSTGTGTNSNVDNSQSVNCVQGRPPVSTTFAEVACQTEHLPWTQDGCCQTDNSAQPGNDFACQTEIFIRIGPVHRSSKSKKKPKKNVVDDGRKTVKKEIGSPKSSESTDFKSTLLDSEKTLSVCIKVPSKDAEKLSVVRKALSNTERKKAPKAEVGTGTGTSSSRNEGRLSFETPHRRKAEPIDSVSRERRHRYRVIKEELDKKRECSMEKERASRSRRRRSRDSFDKRFEEGRGKSPVKMSHRLQVGRYGYRNGWKYLNRRSRSQDRYIERKGSPELVRDKLRKLRRSRSRDRHREREESPDLRDKLRRSRSRGRYRERDESPDLRDKLRRSRSRDRHRERDESPDLRDKLRRSRSRDRQITHYSDKRQEDRTLSTTVRNHLHDRHHFWATNEYVGWENQEALFTASSHFQHGLQHLRPESIDQEYIDRNISRSFNQEYIDHSLWAVVPESIPENNGGIFLQAEPQPEGIHETIAQSPLSEEIMGVVPQGAALEGVPVLAEPGSEQLFSAKPASVPEESAVGEIVADPVPKPVPDVTPKFQMFARDPKPIPVLVGGTALSAAPRPEAISDSTVPVPLPQRYLRFPFPRYHHEEVIPNNESAFVEATGTDVGLEFSCGTCESKFSTYNSYEMHYRMKHSNNFYFCSK